MRITLNIDDDVLVVVKEIAARESKSAGTIVSNLLRQSLTHDGPEKPRGGLEPVPEFGFRPIPKQGGTVTNELIDRLREEIGD